MASHLKLMVFIILSLLLSAILCEENEHKIDGISMTLHMKSKSRKKISIEEPLKYPGDTEYYMRLSVGTPAQDVWLVMDTGSDVVWVPCTRNYSCNGCTDIYSRVFLPSKSSSAVPVKCADPMCKELCEYEGCATSNQNCVRSNQNCPNYALEYGTGNTTGRLLSETLTLPLEDGGKREIKHFAVGCSKVSSILAGIAGFGRGALSMPSQLSPLLGDRFAYCLDSENKSRKIVLGDRAVPKDIPLYYTPLLINTIQPFYSTFYYIGLEGVSIGGKRLTLPSNLTTFDSEGNGGTIIDSGHTFTSFPEEMYNQIASEFASRIRYRRAPETLLELCYNVSGVKNIEWPKFAFHFKGGSHMVLSDDNSFRYTRSDIMCLAIENSGPPVGPGPAVSLGNVQQSNFYILYDRKKDRLGFVQGDCKTFGL